MCLCFSLVMVGCVCCCMFVLWCVLLCVKLLLFDRCCLQLLASLCVNVFVGFVWFGWCNVGSARLASFVAV